MTPEEILAGPRGRGLLLELAQALDEEVRLLTANLEYELDPGKGRSRVRMLFGDGAPGLEPPAPTVDDAVRALRGVDPVRITVSDLDAGLAASVGWAMYWQPPSGEDVLATLPEIADALRPLAEAVSQHPPAWWSANRRVEQWVIEWRGPGDPVPSGIDTAAALAADRRRTIADDERAARERPRDVTANWSGSWWSTPTASSRRRG